MEILHLYGECNIDEQNETQAKTVRGQASKITRHYTSYVLSEIKNYKWLLFIAHLYRFWRSTMTLRTCIVRFSYFNGVVEFPFW